MAKKKHHGRPVKKARPHATGIEVQKMDELHRVDLVLKALEQDIVLSKSTPKETRDEIINDSKYSYEKVRDAIRAGFDRSISRGGRKEIE